MTLFIGIDPGVTTGLAVWDSDARKLLEVTSYSILSAMDKVLTYPDPKVIMMEDARLRDWYKGGREKLQGVGSVKRDCKIWDEFAELRGIPIARVAPKNNRTKMRADAFEKVTKWQARTNEHARDAAMLVWGR